MVLAAQGLKTKAGEHAPAPPPLQTERKVEKGPLFAHNDPPHKNPGYGPVRKTDSDNLNSNVIRCMTSTSRPVQIEANLLYPDICDKKVWFFWSDQKKNQPISTLAECVLGTLAGGHY